MTMVMTEKLYHMRTCSINQVLMRLNGLLFDVVGMPFMEREHFEFLPRFMFEPEIRRISQLIIIIIIIIIINHEY